MPRKTFRTLSNPGRRPGFNEAAARCRGKRSLGMPDTAADPPLQ